MQVEPAPAADLVERERELDVLEPVRPSQPRDERGRPEVVGRLRVRPLLRAGRDQPHVARGLRVRGEAACERDQRPDPGRVVVRPGRRRHGVRVRHRDHQAVRGRVPDPDHVARLPFARHPEPLVPDPQTRPLLNRAATRWCAFRSAALAAGRCPCRASETAKLYASLPLGAAAARAQHKVVASTRRICHTCALVPSQPPREASRCHARPRVSQPRADKVDVRVARRRRAAMGRRRRRRSPGVRPVRSKAISSRVSGGSASPPLPGCLRRGPPDDLTERPLPRGRQGVRRRRRHLPLRRRLPLGHARTVRLPTQTSPRRTEARAPDDQHAPRKNIDATTLHGIPVTTPIQTLIHLSSVLPFKTLRRAVNEALNRRLITPEQLVTTAPPRREEAPRASSPRPPRPAPRTRTSPSHLLHEAGIAKPLVNPRIRGTTKIPDFLWPDRNLILEADSRRYHDQPARPRRRPRQAADPRSPRLHRHPHLMGRDDHPPRPHDHPRSARADARRPAGGVGVEVRVDGQRPPVVHHPQPGRLEPVVADCPATRRRSTPRPRRRHRARSTPRRRPAGRRAPRRPATRAASSPRRLRSRGSATRSSPTRPAPAAPRTRPPGSAAITVGTDTPGRAGTVQAT